MSNPLFEALGAELIRSFSSSCSAFSNLKARFKETHNRKCKNASKRKDNTAAAQSSAELCATVPGAYEVGTFYPAGYL